MKEIGGYFQLEEMPGEEYYPDLYRVNLGRTAGAGKSYYRIFCVNQWCIPVRKIR